MNRTTLLSFVTLLLLLPALWRQAHAQDLVHLATTDLPDLPVALSDPLIGVVNGEPVVLGGWLNQPDTTVWSDQAFSYDDENHEWQTVDAWSGIGRPGAATSSVGNSLLVIGGQTDSGWSTDVVELSDGEDSSVSSKEPLPEAIRNPSAAAVGQNVTVVGFTSPEGAPVEASAFQIDLFGLAPSWTALPPLPLEREGTLVLEYQDGGFNLVSSSEDGTYFEMHRYTSLLGWVAKSSPDPAVHVIGAMALGQAHIAWVSPSEAGRHEVWSYSVISDTWAEMGEVGQPQTRMHAKPVGDALLTSEWADTGGTRMAITTFEVGKRPFHWIDFLAVAVYLACMILIGLYFSKKEEGTEDFFVGGRKMPWWAVGFSLYATGTSAISFMAIPAKSYATDWLYFMQNLIGFLAIIPVAMIIVPLIRRLNLTTTYQYLEMRFHTVIRLMGSILNMTYQLGARMSVVLFLPALALSAVTGVDVVTSILFMGAIATIYTVLGGIKAVIWTDVVQVVVLLGGAFLCLGIIVVGIDGGIGELVSVATADSKTHLFDWRMDLTIPTVWLFMILATADTITWPKDQVMVQRVLSTKTAKEAGFSVWTLTAIVVPGSITFFALGTALYSFYKLHPEKLSPLLNLDATLPYFIAAELPVGIAGLIIAALFAASMSTLDSSMNSVATLIVVDFYQRFKKGVTDAQALRLAKWITVLTGAFGTIFALILTRYSLPSLWDTFIMLTGLLGGGFGGVYALGMFTRRANWQGALVGIITSIVVTLLVKAYTNIHVLLYVGVAVFTCVVVGYVVSLFFPTQESRLKGLTVYRQDRVADGEVTVHTYEAGLRSILEDGSSDGSRG
jgi:SSS family transporter